MINFTNLLNYILIIYTILLVLMIYLIFVLSKMIQDLKNLRCVENESKNLEKTKQDIKVLNDEKYYYYVINLLKSAKREISIVMFSIFCCKKTEELINELINVRKRGVMVRIILDRNVESNKKVRNRLSSERISVRTLNSERTHNKLIIVDDTVVVGSHNWTDKALFENRESSVAIVDKNILTDEKEYFEFLWRLSK